MTSTISHRRGLEESLFRALPLLRYVGSGSCPHTFSLWVRSEASQFCGLCFLREGYSAELPMKLHLSKTLADNGNPQQTGKLESHVSVTEGIIAIRADQTTKQFSRARRNMGSAPSPNLFPFASALWEVMGRQPPLGIPLARSVLGETEVEVANALGYSLYNTLGRLSKGVDMAVRLVWQYDDSRRKANATSERHYTANPE